MHSPRRVSISGRRWMRKPGVRCGAALRRSSSAHGVRRGSSSRWPRRAPPQPIAADDARSRRRTVTRQSPARARLPLYRFSDGQAAPRGAERGARGWARIEERADGVERARSVRAGAGAARGAHPRSEVSPGARAVAASREAVCHRGHQRRHAIPRGRGRHAPRSRAHPRAATRRSTPSSRRSRAASARATRGAILHAERGGSLPRAGRRRPPRRAHDRSRLRQRSLRRRGRACRRRRVRASTSIRAPPGWLACASCSWEVASSAHPRSEPPLAARASWSPTASVRAASSRGPARASTWCSPIRPSPAWRSPPDSPSRPWRRGVERDVLFVERALDLLGPGGRLGIILPHGKLAGSSWSRFRHFLHQRARIGAGRQLAQRRPSSPIPDSAPRRSSPSSAAPASARAATSPSSLRRASAPLPRSRRRAPPRSRSRRARPRGRLSALLLMRISRR